MFLIASLKNEKKITIKIIIIEKGKTKLKLVTSGQPNSTEAPLLSCANLLPYIIGQNFVR